MISCWALNVDNPVPGVLPDGPSTNGYAGGFGVSLMAKDLSIAKETAKKTKVKNVLGDICYKDYIKLIDEGKGSKDFGIIYQKLIDSKLKQD